MLPYSRRSYVPSNDFHTYDYGHKAQDEIPRRSSVAPSPFDRNFSMATNMWSTPVSVNCGELRMRDKDMLVRMTGRIKFQRLHRFFSLRDSHGTTQVVAPEERLTLMRKLRDIPADAHVEIVGTVQLRPRNTVNVKMETGAVEVLLQEILDVFAPKRKWDEVGDADSSGQAGKKPRVLLLTSEEITRCGTNKARKKFQERTHSCGELNSSHAGLQVTLCGWIESMRTQHFTLLRDGYGTTQLVHMGSSSPIIEVMKTAKLGMLFSVKGIVELRPENQWNPRLPTGKVEVKAWSMDVIDTSEADSEEPDSIQENGNMEVQNQTENLPGDVNSYCNRTHTCGELRSGDVGKDVILYGWLASQRTNRFGIIRDGHGSTQLLVPSSRESDIGGVLSQATLESVVMAAGTVSARPPDQVVDRLSTGEIEVLLKELKVINPAKKDLPFIIRTNNRPKEPLRMKYRYLDMRFSDMQFRLRLRSKVIMAMREFLINKRGFVEIETPTLFRRTPGGAQEFVVPTRNEGKFYSLVQSPQQLKQLLMIGAMDRYFQVARCYRDEGSRPDRQPEFTQMDIELSFTTSDMIMKLVEDLLKASFPNDLVSVNTPFPVIKYQEAMHWYGSDKPDLSFDKKLIDISDAVDKRDLLPENVLDVKRFTAKAIFMGSSCTSARIKDVVRDCEDVQKMRGDSRAKMFVVHLSKDTWKESVESALPFVDPDKLKDIIEFPVPSTIVVGVGQQNHILPLLGKLRFDIFHKQTSDFHFAWIVDFPLFLEGDDGTPESAHHPFTQPNEEDSHLLDSEPFKVRGQHFDLVLNGFEVGGGSVRIHDPVMQTKVLKDILKIPTESLEHLLEALASGSPPHGGIALGIDRLLSIVLDAESIRDVIAFPKGVDGKDPLSGAPCSLSAVEKKLYHLIPRSQ